MPISARSPTTRAIVGGDRRQARRAAHPRQQRGHHPPQQRHRFHRGRLGRGARRESQVGVLPVAGGGAPHDPERRRQDHQHRVDAVVPGRHPRALLHRQQERHRRPHEAAGQRVGRERHQRERDRAGIFRHQQHGGAAGGRRSAMPKSSGAFRPAAGEIPTIWVARRCFSRRAPRTTSRASSCPSTAAGWRADPRFGIMVGDANCVSRTRKHGRGHGRAPARRRNTKPRRLQPHAREGRAAREVGRTRRRLAARSGAERRHHHRHDRR